jgi:hypothetical protein
LLIAIVVISKLYYIKHIVKGKVQIKIERIEKARLIFQLTGLNVNK